VVVALTCALAVFCTSASAANVFSRLAFPTAEERYAPAAATLPDGNVLIAGGDATETVKNVELFNAKTEAFEKLTGPGEEMAEARAEFAAVTLPDGKVLLVGGDQEGPILQTAELFSPQTNTFELLKSPLTEPRDAPGIALLHDGMVLIVDGCEEPGTCANTAELYDPATQTFSKIASPTTEGRYYPAAATLPDGNVLIAGGYDKTTLKSAELFNAKTNTFEKLEGASHEMHEPREELAAVTLQDGKVLIVGGDDGGLRPATAELFNPKSNAFELVSAPLTSGREAAGVALLQDGRVLIADGCQAGFCEKTGEIMSVNPPSRASSTRPTRRSHYRERLNALVEAETNSTVYFQYGTSRRYRHRTRTQAIAGSTTPVAVSALLTRLTPGKRYHYRVVIESDAGKLTGSDRTFVVPRRRR
jgi:hypothetical protein